MPARRALLSKTICRETPNGAWIRTAATLRRVDQTISSTGETAIVQGDLHVYAESGAVIFESTGLYGVNRFNRQNVPGYGDTERTGAVSLSTGCPADHLHLFRIDVHWPVRRHL